MADYLTSAIFSFGQEDEGGSDTDRRISAANNANKKGDGKPTSNGARMSFWRKWVRLGR
jgi:hypothetical protein